MSIARIFVAAFLVCATLPAAFAPANRPYQVKHYFLKLELDPSKNPDTFAAEVDIQFRPTEAMGTLTLDADDLSIDKVTLVKPTKRTLTFSANDKHLDIVLPGRLKPGRETWTVRIAYKGKVHSSHTGLFKVTDPDEPARGPLLFTHFEPMEARTFFPCYDEPYAKATFEVAVTTPAPFEVLSNGDKRADKKIRRGNEQWHEVRWESAKPFSTYLLAIAVGQFSKIESGKIALWVGSKKTGAAAYGLDVTKKAMAYFEKYLSTPYPWSKYAIVGIPTFLWGGMENASVTFQNQERTVLNDPKSAFEKIRITELVAHELAHQWFGDDVTLRWWNDTWLNESFASYLENLASKHLFGNEQAEISLVTETWDSYFRQEDGPRSHPIVQKEMASAEEAFDSINYTKGENVLRMLSFYTGEDKFKKGMAAYLKKSAYGSATSADFFTAMEKAAGEDLGQFQKSWLLSRGYPVVTYGGKWDSTATAYKLTLIQAPNHPDDKTIYRFRLPVVFHRKASPAYAKRIVVDMGKGEVSRQDFSTVLPAEPEWVTVNPGFIVLGKMQPGDRDEGILAAQALGDEDPIARVWGGYELASELLAGKSASSSAERNLAEMLKGDNSPYVRAALLNAFQKMKTRWLPTRLGDTIFELARAATAKGATTSPLYLSDELGWSLWRSELLGTLGKVERSEVLPFLAEQLARRDLPLDDLGQASISVARLGDDKSAGVLKSALALHRARGYRYQYVIQLAYGAIENPRALVDIKETIRTAAPDLVGKWTGLIKDNQALKNASEWADFLKEFTLHNTRFSDEVKARLLESIEEVKTDAVKSAMEAIAKESKSDRLKEAAKKILDKNFSKADAPA